MTGAVILAAAAGMERKVYGAQDTGMLTLSQSAAWTEENQYRAEVTLTIQGLDSYFKQQINSASSEETQPVEQMSDTTGTFVSQDSLGQYPSEENPDGNTEPHSAAGSAEATRDPAGSEEGSPRDKQNTETQGAYRQDIDEQESEIQSADNQSTGPQGADNQSAESQDADNQSAEIQAADIPNRAVQYTEQAGEGKIDGAEMSSSLSLVYFLSEYFLPDTQKLPSFYIAEELTVSKENGEQTSVIKITIPLLPNASYTEPAVYTLPLLLKEEFQDLGQGCSYPVSREISLQEGDGGQGVYLIRNTDSQILAKASMTYLDVKPVSADFQLSVNTAPQTPKAGEWLTYEIVLKNTGEIPLTQIQLKNNFSQGGLTLVWEQAQGVTMPENGQGALLDMLEKGETRTLYAFVDLPESQEETFTNIFHIICQNPAAPQTVLERQAQVETGVTPLKAEFTVEKTADRTTAFPGETIRYQICIRNTGEKTLHSVLSTERFLSSNIQAQFLEKEGVELNAAKNQALIPQILPGEAFALEAAVTLPLNMVSQELINQVIVVSRETGTRSVQSQAGIQVQALPSTPTPTPWLTQYPVQNTLYKSGGSLAKQASSYPKTEDESPIAFWAVTAGGALLVTAAAFHLGKGKRKH